MDGLIKFLIIIGVEALVIIMCFIFLFLKKRKIDDLSYKNVELILDNIRNKKKGNKNIEKSNN